MKVENGVSERLNIVEGLGMRAERRKRILKRFLLPFHRYPDFEV